MTSVTSNIGSDTGLTLVELLVVIVIIGLMTSVVTLSLPSQSENERQRLEYTAAQFKALRNEAILSGKIMGIILSKRGYKFVVFDEGSWHEKAGSPCKAICPWAENPPFYFELKSSPFLLAIDFAQTSAQIKFFPDGKTTPFILKFGSPANVLTIEGPYDALQLTCETHMVAP